MSTLAEVLKELRELDEKATKGTIDLTHYALLTSERTMGLLQVIEKQREALEFYAQNKMFSSDPYCSVFDGWTYKDGDKRAILGGEVARKALAFDPFGAP